MWGVRQQGVRDPGGPERGLQILSCTDLPQQWEAVDGGNREEGWTAPHRNKQHPTNADQTPSSAQ